MGDRDWFTCECGCHAYKIELLEDELESLVVISLWYRGQDWRWGWRDRLRHIWGVIRYGHPDVEEVLLTPACARGLASTIRLRADEADWAGA